MKICLCFCVFVFYFYTIQAQTPFIDTLVGLYRYDNEYIFSDRNNQDSIPNDIKIIGCYRILTKKEISILKKHNHFVQIYGVNKKNLKEITNFQNIISLGINTHKNIEEVKKLKNLTHFSIYSEKGKFIPDEIFSVINLTNISIELHGKKLKLDNLYKFSTMPNLNFLSLEFGGNSKNFDASQLEKLRNIKCLSISFTPTIQLSNNFYTLDNLIFLEIGGDKFSLEKNIEIISKMKNLKYMSIFIDEPDKFGLPDNLHKLGFLKELRVCLLSSEYLKLDNSPDKNYNIKTYLLNKQYEIRQMFPNTLVGF